MFNCLMLSTPLMKIRKNLNTVFVMWLTMFLVEAILLLIIFPLYFDQEKTILACVSIFCLTLLLHIVTMCMDPGYLKKPKDVTFMKILEEFDPVLLCPDCEVIRTEKSRHCSVCNRCVERFDHHCPWINNCVGTNNHGIFSFFLTSIATLVIMIFIVVLVNMECHLNIHLPRNEYNFFVPMLLPAWFYSEEVIIAAIYFCAAVCGFFILPVT
jgi:hypothetical protein